MEKSFTEGGTLNQSYGWAWCAQNFMKKTFLGIVEMVRDIHESILPQIKVSHYMVWKLVKVVRQKKGSS